MKFDLMLDPTPTTVGDSCTAARDDGFDGGWVIETRHDPFLLLNTAATRRTGLQLGTAVAVGFARSPMILAQLANDLQIATEGRFVLGLGTQVKPHIERRFSMPWGRPAPQMREMLVAIHAIFDAWETGSRLDHKGEYYTHTLMTDAFSPGPSPYGRPPIYLGALGPAMTELAGQLADGLVVHRFMSERFLREVTLPRLRRGLAGRARPLERPFQVVYPPFAATCDDPEGSRRQLDAIRSQVAFYASTPTYRPLLDLHGWADLGDELHALSRAQEWQEMSRRVPDEVLETVAVVAPAADLRADLERRFGGLIDRCILFPEEKAPSTGNPPREADR
ncbi:TIGR03617 family F420-dependent LLM class oxidoreductase [Acrocarpospora catenulata]|uniref:TIGR03617 family F420-dependent LLM class oxidoreductase n=1 Tax=Acrocarpospora catenulata TaxID=2836182 RepID=UPI001BDA3ED0|nr:TIGR03617 family F420-dependent LLM class oxidoreductase [Acrocarpospora catenulata]